MNLERKKIVIAGGSGFVGVSLAHHLAERGATVVIISRNRPKATGPWRHVTWDGQTVGTWRNELDGAAGLVNLAGRSVDCVKTPDHQDEILRSRVASTRLLGRALRDLESPPDVWVQMSTAHIYGDPPSAVCTEESEFGYGLAPFVGQAWEAAFEASALPSQRRVILRTSFVLGRNRGCGGGALDKLAALARIGLGGRVGDGSQGVSWIHEIDLNRLFERALTNPAMHGTYIASAPNPASQVEFARELRRAVGMRIGLPAYSWMVRIGVALILHTDPDLALWGRYVVPKRLLEENFQFELPELRDALCRVFDRTTR